MKRETFKWTVKAIVKLISWVQSFLEYIRYVGLLFLPSWTDN